ncbi:unnamed protein product [Phaeothamnion confervicola]
MSNGGASSSGGDKKKEGSAGTRSEAWLASEQMVWQDREIRFDAAPTLLGCRRGERVVDSINSVEDTKGNSGERGSLIVTTLRMLWISHKSTRTNLSIGFNTVLNISIRKARSKLRGSTQALCVLTKHENSRFEFIFTSLVNNSPRLFTTVQAVLRAYETSKLYRDLRLRGSIVRDSQLLLLPGEEICSQVQGVWNLSSDQGNLGTFFLTNVRVVWHANLAQNFNVSIPYMQMKCVRIRDSKFGKALVVEAAPKAGGYILGFRMDPLERLVKVVHEMCSLHDIYSTCPVFGVCYAEEEEAASLEQRQVPRVDDGADIIESALAGGGGADGGGGGGYAGEESDALAAYYADPMKAADREVTFDAGLGLAVEALPAGATIEMLWRVV